MITNQFEGAIIIAFMCDIGAGLEQGVGVQLVGPSVAAGAQVTNAIIDVRNDLDTDRNWVAPGLVVAGVGVEVHVTHGLLGAVAQHEDIVCVRVDVVYVHGVRGVEMDEVWSVCEVRAGWVEAGYAAEAGDLLASVARGMRAEGVTQQVDVSGVNTVLADEEVDEVSNLQPDHSDVG